MWSYDPWSYNPVRCRLVPLSECLVIENENRLKQQIRDAYAAPFADWLKDITAPQNGRYPANPPSMAFLYSNKTLNDLYKEILANACKYTEDRPIIKMRNLLAWLYNNCPEVACYREFARAVVQATGLSAEQLETVKSGFDSWVGPVYREKEIPSYDSYDPTVAPPPPICLLFSPYV